ncbi:MAG TPA: ATP synthase F1 subunit epsilon [Solirubrobacteraceae bacterium]|nr:ATP synthase F1 subunit epsilon [Solirubrobacteraceae bacterium]
MAHAKFTVEVLTPEGEVFKEEVEMLSTRTSVGSIGVLAHHQPLLAMLDPTELRLYRSESDIVRFAQAEGYLQMTGEHALVLVEEAIAPEDLDRPAIEDRLRQAEQAAERAEDGSEEQARAQRDAKRARAFLEVGEGS